MCPASDRKMQQLSLLEKHPDDKKSEPGNRSSDLLGSFLTQYLDIIKSIDEAYDSAMQYCAVLDTMQIRLGRLLLAAVPGSKPKLEEQVASSLLEELPPK